jgi:hypothetical protein
MARIIVGSYLVRFPLGGYISWVLQCLVGFQRLGHEVYFVEKAGWENSCFNPVNNTMGDDCLYGKKILKEILSQFHLEGNWCFVDINNQYHGLTQKQIENLFKSADLFFDMGTHGTWSAEAQSCNLRVLIDGEPGTTQMKMEKSLASGETLPEYDFYYTVGRNIGKENCTAPTAGKQWRHTVWSVNADLYPQQSVPSNSPFTTVMSWQAHQPLVFEGQTYGQKDIEFAKFMNLPGSTNAELEIAVAGENIPYEELKQNGWSVKDSHSISLTLDSFNQYILKSKGEFTVCKNVFVRTNSGWFSDRSAVYLACGRPVVMQDTGFSKLLPCGHGLFAVRTTAEAASAIEEINGNYESHSKRAREIAYEHLDALKVLAKLLDEIGF